MRRGRAPRPGFWGQGPQFSLTDLDGTGIIEASLPADPAGHAQITEKHRHSFRENGSAKEDDGT